MNKQQNTKKRPVTLIVGRGLYALQLVKSYDLAGHKVILATTEFKDFTRASISVWKSFVIPRPDVDSKQFAREISRIILEQEVTLVVPAAEESLFLALELPDMVKFTSNCFTELGCRFLTSPFKQLEDLHHKMSFVDMVNQAGLKAPQTLLSNSFHETVANVRNMLKTLGPQSAVVVKPALTRGGRDLVLVKYDEDPESTLLLRLRKSWPSHQIHSSGDADQIITKERPFLVQEFILGTEFSTYSVCKNGRVLAHVTYEASFPVKGFSTIRECVRKPAMLAWVKRFIRFHGFTGQLGFDFIESMNGVLMPLECNPRATNGISFFATNQRSAKLFVQSQIDASITAEEITNMMDLPKRTSSDLSASSVSSDEEDSLTTSAGESKKQLEEEPAETLAKVESHVIQPEFGLIISSLLPALSVAFKDAKLWKKLRQSENDMVWISDPFPFMVAILRIVLLFVASLNRLVVKGERFADIVAHTTEEEVTKFDLMVSSSTSTTTTESQISNKKKVQLPELKKCRILVTGSTGFLGSRLVTELARQGCETIIATGRRQLNGVKDGRVKFVATDLTDRSSVRELCRNVDVVYHCAAMCTPWGDYEDFYESNVKVTEFLVQSSIEAGVKLFVHVSSPSICFSVNTKPVIGVSEKDKLPDMKDQSNYYAMTKLIAEKVVQNAHDTQNLNTIIIRPRAIFGEGDTSLFPRIISRLRLNKLPQIGDGNTVVDLTCVENVVESLICCITKANHQAAVGGIYNITDASPIKLWSVLHRICDELDLDRPRIMIPHAVAFGLATVLENIFLVLLKAGITRREPLLSRYAVNVLALSQTLDCSAAQQDLGYKPVMTTNQGITKFLTSILLEEEEGSKDTDGTDTDSRQVLKKRRERARNSPFNKSAMITQIGASLLWALLFSYCLDRLVFQTIIFSSNIFFLENRYSASFSLCICFFVTLAMTKLFFDQRLKYEELRIIRRKQKEKRVMECIRKQQSQNESSNSLNEHDEFVDADSAKVQDNEKNIRKSTKVVMPRAWENTSLSLDERFHLATQNVAPIALRVPKTTVAEMYGIFKQQKSGDCTIDAPSRVNVIEYAKWKSWSDNKGLTTSQARELYIQKLSAAYDYLEENNDVEANDREDLAAAAKELKNVAYNVRIAGVGRYLPERVVTNEEVEKLCGLPEGWSNEHNIGAKTRRWADYLGKESNSLMASYACKDACKNANLKLDDIDCLINASASNERILPDGSCLVKRALGLEGNSMACLSVHATCLSFVMAMDLAASLIQCKRYKRIMIVSSEISSVACNFQQPESAMLLGDGAAACILEASPAGSKSVFLKSHFENFCEGLDHATVRTGTNHHPKDPQTRAEDHMFDMDGHGVMEVVQKYGTAYLERLRPGLSTRLPVDFDLVIPHQPSGKGLDFLEAHGWPRNKIVRIIEHTGNCVAASPGMALYEAVQSGKLRRGDKALIIGTGSGILLGGITFVY